MQLQYVIFVAQIHKGGLSTKFKPRFMYVIWRVLTRFLQTWFVKNKRRFVDKPPLWIRANMYQVLDCFSV